jgi:hypothetical protein
LPTGRCPGAIGKTKKQFLNFIQSEAGSPRAVSPQAGVDRLYRNVFAHSFSESEEVFRSVRSSELLTAEARLLAPPRKWIIVAFNSIDDPAPIAIRGQYEKS